MLLTVGVFDNGDDRVFPSGESCQSSNTPPCPYSTAVSLQVDEMAKTATITFQEKPTPFYSFFGGNTELLKNGSVEFDLAASGNNESDIYEVTPTGAQQTIWHMHVNQYAYRAFRMPSLYPGVQW